MTLNTKNMKLKEALRDLEYFKRKLTKAIGTPMEENARERCEMLEAAIENYKKSIDDTEIKRQLGYSRIGRNNV